MLIQPEDPEKLLIYGEHACGKTHAWLSIADTLRIMGNTHVRFYVIDTDAAVGKNIQHFPELRESGMIVRKSVSGFPDGIGHLENWSKIAKPQDWIVVDKACDLWEDLPNHYVETRLQCDPDELERQYRTQEEGKYKGGTALLQYYGSGINPMWKRMLKKVFSPLCNVVFVCSEAEVREKDDGQFKTKNEVKQQFISVKRRPAGQKGTPFKFDTILHFSQPYLKQFRMTTVRERGLREWYGREAVMNFGTQYLIGNAGWEVV